MCANENHRGRRSASLQEMIQNTPVFVLKSRLLTVLFTFTFHDMQLKGNEKFKDVKKKKMLTVFPSLNLGGEMSPYEILYGSLLCPFLFQFLPLLRWPI